MKIAITSDGKDLNSLMDLRFGRAKYFIIYDTDTKTHIAYDNQVNLNQSQGAGVQSAQKIVDLEADVLISGNCGPKAFVVLEAADIKIYTSSNISIKEAISSFQNNKLSEITSANVEGHWS